MMNYFWRTEFDWITGATSITTNWTSPTVVSQSVNTDYTNWTDINALLDSDPSNYAECYIENSEETTYKSPTEMLILSGFTFGIPTGSTILGIEIKIVRGAFDVVTGNYIQPCVPADIVYDDLVLVNKTIFSSDITGSNKSKPFFRGNCTYPQSGTWENTLCVVYGSSSDLWGQDWTPESASTLVVKIRPFVELVAKSGSTVHSVYIRVNSLVARVTYSPGVTGYIQQERQYNRNTSNTIESYKAKFNYHQCIGPNGICFNYIKDINDIYGVSLMTGDGNSINNMYTEYDSIKEYAWNIYQADIAVGGNPDLSKSYYQLDGLSIRPGWNVLVWQHTAKTFNDIYTVDRNYYLRNSGILSSRASSERARVYIKSGSSKDKQYFLVNEGNQFPITGETKTFVEGHGYILKNQVRYDINNTATAFTYNITGQTMTQPSALLFTNYETARRMNSENASLYDMLVMNIPMGTYMQYDTRAAYSTTPKLSISYLNYTYDIFLSGERTITLSGTSGTISLSGFCYNTISGMTIILPGSGFTNVSQVGDTVEMLVYNTTIPVENFHLLKHRANILSQTTTTVTLQPLPGHIINYLNTLQYWSIVLINRQFAGTGLLDLITTINASPFYELLEACGSGNTLSLVAKDYYKYVDFSLLTLSSDTAYHFHTDNQYINYKLDEFVKRIDLEIFADNTVIYNQNYLFRGQFTVSAVTFYPPMSNTGYTIKTLAYYGRDNDIYGLKIYPKAGYTDRLKYFKPFTYVDLGRLLTGTTTITDPVTHISTTYTSPSNPPQFIKPSGIGLGDTSGRTLITEVTEDYILLEVPMAYQTTLINNVTDWIKDSDIINVSTLSDISDCLYDVYTNYTHAPYYFKQPDNKRYKVCEKYAEVIKECSLLRKNFTGLFYHMNGDFALDLFKVNVDTNFVQEDPNLYYIPVEIIDIGVDKKSKMPRTLDISDFTIPNVAQYWSYTASTFDVEIGGKYITSFVSAISKSACKDGIIQFGINWQGILDVCGKQLKGYASSSTTWQDHPDYLRNSAFIKLDTGGTLIDSWVGLYDVNALTVFDNTVLYMQGDIIINRSAETFVDGYIKRELLFANQNPNHIYFSGITLIHTNSGSTTENFGYGLNSTALVVSGITTILNDSAAIQLKSSSSDLTANTYGVSDKDTIFTALAIDINDGLYWGGSSNATLFSYSSSTIYTPYSGYTAFVIKTYPNTAYWWHTILGSANYNTTIKSICTDSKMNSYIVAECSGGTIQFGTGKTDINSTDISTSTAIVCKINQSGAFSWSKTMTCTDVLATKKIIESGGYLYIFGEYKGTITCDTYTSTSSGNFNLFILKLRSSDGLVMPFGINSSTEIMSIGGISSDYFSDTKAFGDYIYLLGRYIQSTIVGAFNLVGNAYEQSYLAKIDKSTGIVISILPINSSGALKAMSLEIDPSGCIYVSGDFDGKVKMDKKKYSATKRTFFVWKLIYSQN